LVDINHNICIIYDQTQMFNPQNHQQNRSTHNHDKNFADTDDETGEGGGAASAARRRGQHHCHILHVCRLFTSHTKIVTFFHGTWGQDRTATCSFGGNARRASVHRRLRLLCTLSAAPTTSRLHLQRTKPSSRARTMGLCLICWGGKHML
jgi:hypothetical protein